MSKPKEFWIAPKLYSPIDPIEAEYYVAYDQKGDPKRLEIHVIEYQAYEKLQAALDVARETLIKIGCNETFHRLGGIDDCKRCLALTKIEELLRSNKLPNQQQSEARLM